MLLHHFCSLKAPVTLGIAWKKNKTTVYVLQIFFFHVPHKKDLEQNDDFSFLEAPGSKRYKVNSIQDTNDSIL